LLNQLGNLKYNRDSLILALGGGVVGDTAGLVATLINRGVTYVQIPTSTLAQADSAIGGKTGVDLDAGKNLAGVIRQPNRVYMDVKTLGTLDERNYRAGLVETVKHGIILDATFFEWLENNIEAVLDRDEKALIYLAQQNSRIKGSVVEIDPNEKGLRKILNYGHTLGHAIETASRYTLLHGEAINLGMRAAAKISNDANIFPTSDLHRQNDLLNRLGMPRKIPMGITNEDILAITLSDKKVVNGKANYCIPQRIGFMREYDGRYVIPVDLEIVKQVLNFLR
jgi:3-dehydroquinate synthase